VTGVESAGAVASADTVGRDTGRKDKKGKKDKKKESEGCCSGTAA